MRRREAGIANLTRATHWSDGTPIWRGTPFPEPWGSDPRDRWVRVMADLSADGVWDVSGVGGSCDELPVGGALIARIRAWQDWNDRLDAEYSSRFPESGRLYWEAYEDAPVAEFNAEGRVIAEALKAELPDDWTVVYEGM